ncbi:Uncharacterised protein [Bordetella trematum]|nr:Uncharacterised protein [Bordetella trematum]
MGDAPVVIREVGVHQPDRPQPGLDLDEQRQGAQLPANLQLFRRIEEIQPLPAMPHMVDVRHGVAQGPAPRQLLVVAAHGMKPRVAQPLHHPMRFRPAIDQVAYGEQAIRFCGKADPAQGGLQLAEAAMDIPTAISRPAWLHENCCSMAGRHEESGLERRFTVGQVTERGADLSTGMPQRNKKGGRQRPHAGASEWTCPQTRSLSIMVSLPRARLPPRLSNANHGSTHERC